MTSTSAGTFILVQNFSISLLVFSFKSSTAFSYMAWRFWLEAVKSFWRTSTCLWKSGICLFNEVFRGKMKNILNLVFRRIYTTVVIFDLALCTPNKLVFRINYLVTFFKGMLLKLTFCSEVVSRVSLVFSLSSFILFRICSSLANSSMILVNCFSDSSTSLSKASNLPNIVRSRFVLPKMVLDLALIR